MPLRMSLLELAKKWAFRPIGRDEFVGDYRAALADHIGTRDVVEAAEVVAGPWAQPNPTIGALACADIAVYRARKLAQQLKGVIDGHTNDQP